MILCATLNWGFGYLIIHDAASKMPLNALMFSRYLIASGVLILIFRKRFAVWILAGSVKEVFWGFSSLRGSTFRLQPCPARGSRREKQLLSQRCIRSACRS